MAAAKRLRKTPKPPQGRPVSTALISQPAAEDNSTIYALSSFSSRGELFAYVSLAVDKHRLRVYNTTTGQAIADHIIDAARVSSVIWATLDLGRVDSTEGPQPSKKKRKKRDSIVTSEVPSKAAEMVVLGLRDGSILYFSPSHGRVLRTLSHSSSNSAIVALAAQTGHRRWLIWASGQDATLRLWDANKNEIVGSWKNDDRIPYAALTARMFEGEDRIDILAAGHNIRLLSSLGESEGVLPKKLVQLAELTGHASPVKSMKWDNTKKTPTRFISMAEMDRFLYVWDVPDSPDVDGTAAASIPLDSDARSFSLSNSPESSTPPVLLTLSASGKIALYPIPQQISLPSSSNRSPAKLPTLHPRSTIVLAPKRSSIPTPIIDASFVAGDRGKIRVARLIQGVRLVFTIICYLDEAGQFIENLQLEDVPEMSLGDIESLIPSKRYNESSIAVGSGVELGHDEGMDETTVRNIDGDLGVDLAELSLGQRLASVTDAGLHRSSESEDEGGSPTKSQSVRKKSKSELDVIPANSLTRTLIQALHSSDTKLIETCLAHSNADLIRNTVRRLPSQLAIPLLNACVERLGRGARAANMKGGGAGASAQRGMTLVTWIKTVLAVHTGHLMTVPDLVARLSGLHATLTARLALQESLLSLSGKLDMVLSQIEMRSSVAPAPLAPKNGRALSSSQKTTVKHYVEGESDASDDENTQMDVEVEIGDDEGSVENVELGWDSDDDEADDGDGDGDEDEENDSEGSDINEFIDDEAEEYSDEDDDEEDE
ncbi:hypothetical protein D9756_004005 [Leucocoprinus leucothites]|uniref:Small-subunit processome Utp12 domain-containing protein n=1 Tax=Leucocoprinus leucothites TaxID=201217 RepID=A0A8H5G0C6_9AGAR|nr:hypothetical protein D9756_004005 [Leucoagaricus leucothites]